MLSAAAQYAAPSTSRAYPGRTELGLRPLPAELRAALPPELRGLRRDHVRLMVVERDSGKISHTRFNHIGEFLDAGDLLVVNTSRTLAAGLPARRANGTPIQLRPCVRHDRLWDACGAT